MLYTLALYFVCLLACLFAHKNKQCPVGRVQLRRQGGDSIVTYVPLEGVTKTDHHTAKRTPAVQLPCRRCRVILMSPARQHVDRRGTLDATAHAALRTHPLLSSALSETPSLVGVISARRSDCGRVLAPSRPLSARLFILKPQRAPVRQRPRRCR